MARKKPSLLTLVCPVKRVRFTMEPLIDFNTMVTPYCIYFVFLQFDFVFLQNDEVTPF